MVPSPDYTETVFRFRGYPEAFKDWLREQEWSFPDGRENIQSLLETLFSQREDIRLIAVALDFYEEVNCLPASIIRELREAYASIIPKKVTASRSRLRRELSTLSYGRDVLRLFSLACFYQERSLESCDMYEQLADIVIEHLCNQLSVSMERVIKVFHDRAHSRIGSDKARVLQEKRDTLMDRMPKEQARKLKLELFGCVLSGSDSGEFVPPVALVNASDVSEDGLSGASDAESVFRPLL